MNQKAEIWLFTRARLAAAHKDLSDAQLAWRPHESAHSIFEYLYHLAGAEHYWATRLQGLDPRATEYEGLLDAAVKDDFLQEASFPFDSSWFTRDKVEQALAHAYAEFHPVMTEPTPEMLSRQVVSPIGDSIDGAEGLTRIAQHAAYHTGQIWFIRMMPGFPQE